ncbi:MAG: hypothetical protein ABIJ97_10530 [Bacteroidota bacterium]
MKKIYLFLSFFLIIINFISAQEETFDNNRYFKLVQQYQNRQELLDSGFSELDLRSNTMYWYGEAAINMLHEKNPALNNFQSFVLSPDGKNLFGYKDIGYEVTALDSIVFCDTNGVIKNIMSSPVKDDACCNSMRFFTSNSQYVYLTFAYQNLMFIYDHQGQFLGKVENAFLRDSSGMTLYSFLSNDMKNYIYTKHVYDSRKNYRLYYANNKSDVKWISNIDSCFIVFCEIQDSIIIIYGGDRSFYATNNKLNTFRMFVLKRETGEILYSKDYLNNVYCLRNKFIIEINDKFDEYEILY